MAVKPTPNNSLYKGFTFDGIDSRDYGVYISGDAVFDSPERDVEMIEIPGRNGSFALDKGRFGNITVSYTAGLFGDDEASFREGIRALRNALASRKGYCRLEDDYNPNEYRMAVYKKGLEVDPALLKAGEFTIEFDCMPQRWLKSGETAVSVASGGQITNPTLFESHPLLHLWGYGSIGINGDQLSINNDQYGKILLVDKTKHETRGLSKYIYRNSDYPNPKVSLMNEGDTLTLVRGSFISIQLYGLPVVRFTNVSVSVGGGISASVPSGATQIKNVSLTFPEYTFSFGTTKTETIPITITAAYTYEGAQRTATVTGDIRVVYNVGSFYQAVSITILNITNTKPDDLTVSPNADKNGTLQAIYGYSTKRPFAEDADFYFDLDIGEAYKIEDGQTVSVNNAVTIPAKLPVLKSGANTITYDDTITQFKIVPRWWEV